MTIKQQTLEITAASVGTKTMWSGTAIGIWGWLMSSGAIGLAGVIISALGMAATIYFNWRKTRAETRQRELEIELKRREDYRKELAWRAQMQRDHGMTFDAPPACESDNCKPNP